MRNGAGRAMLGAVAAMLLAAWPCVAGWVENGAPGQLGWSVDGVRRLGTNGWTVGPHLDWVLGSGLDAHNHAPSAHPDIQAMLSTNAYTLPTFPVFLIPLGGNWTDFELKASTNNFSDKVYWIASSFSTAYRGVGDSNVWVHFTDNYAYEVMEWRKATNAASIYGQLLNTSSSVVEYVVVQPSHECQVDWTTWMSRENNRLVWSYTRYDGINLDAHWTPIVPIEWRKTRIAP